jgi:hypothetical protein
MDYSSEEEYKQLVTEAVTELRHLFKFSPHLFLTEEDVRCVLFQLLVSKIGLRKYKNGSLTSPVHSEVRWYGKEQNMHKRSDIVVLDVADLRVTSEGFPLPSKGFGFNNFYAAIEIKLRRQGGECDSVWLKKLQKDLDTLRSLKTAVVNRYTPLLMLIAFDRKANIAPKITILQQEISTFYESMIGD